MKPACIPPEINATCIDPTPDGVTCFSYSHCLNVRSGNYYNNADPCDPKNTTGSCVGVKIEPTGCPYGDSIPLNSVKCSANYGSVKELPRTGSSVEILLPIVCTVAIVSIWIIIKKVIKI